MLSSSALSRLNSSNRDQTGFRAPFKPDTQPRHRVRNCASAICRHPAVVPMITAGQADGISRTAIGVVIAPGLAIPPETPVAPGVPVAPDVFDSLRHR